MTASRRSFLKAASAGGAAFLLRVGRDGAVFAGLAAEAGRDAFQPNTWLRIDREGIVTVVVAQAEMGQGVRTALPMIVAEELEADWSRIRLESARPGPGYDLGTSGSDAVAGAWNRLRKAGATARAMLVSAAAGTWRVREAECRADRGGVVHAPSGRRLGYGELVEAARALPVPQDAPLKDPAAFRLIGSPVERLDGPAIVGGRAVYGLDVRVPGLLRAVVARCPVVGGRAARFDAARAKASPGVCEVVPLPSGIAVVADDTWSALEGRRALEVVWDEGPNRGFDSEAHRHRLAEAARAGGRVARDEGDAASALADAPCRLEALYEYAFQAHATLEPMNAVADVREGACAIWAGTQNANRLQAEAAEALGLAPAQVTVDVPLLGGGFGRRLGREHVLEAVLLSKAVRRPVQVVWTRADDMQNGFFHPASAHRLRGALDDGGRPLAISHTVADSSLTLFGPPDLDDPELYEAWGAYDNPYAFPAVRMAMALVDCPVPTGAWRAVQYPPGTFARESFVDEMAHAAGRDPLEFRLALLREPRRLALRVGTIDRDKLRRVLELAAEKAGWGRRPPEGRARGVAANVYDRRNHMAQVAEVSIGPRGRLRVHRVVCAVDCGIVVNPLGVRGQVESGIHWGLSALRTEITLEGGRVRQSSYADYPVAQMEDSPEVEVHTMSSTEPPAGMGEPPVPPLAPAVMNAVFALTGKRIRRLPLRREDLA
jgi:isoquinoline 1-oxidoreductase beta subunit